MQVRRFVVLTRCLRHPELTGRLQRTGNSGRTSYRAAPATNAATI